MKKLVVIGLLVLGGLWVVNTDAVANSKVGRWFRTLWAKGQASIESQLQIPRADEIARVREEVKKLDADIRGLLGPIAEKQAAINRLDREIKTARENLNTQRERLVALTQKVDAGTEQVSVDGENISLDEAKARLNHEFSLFKSRDANFKSREKLLAAQKQNVRYAHQQLTKILEQKREFEVRLAQLEAAEENLNLQQIASPLRVDPGRIADIKNTLDAIQQGQEVERQKRLLEEQYGTKLSNGTPPASTPTVNMQEIRSFLGVPASTPTKVAGSR
jgi:chromosome segregation ATPase